MVGVKDVVVVCAVLAATGGAALAQSAGDSGSANGMSGQTAVPGGVIQWRFVPVPRFEPPTSRYRRTLSGPRYARTTRNRSGEPGASTLSPAAPTMSGEGLLPPLRYRFDERRGTWIAERATGL
jgi:hypothetical protein